MADVSLHRETLERVLAWSSGVEVIGSEAHLREASPKISKTLPEVVLVDLPLHEGIFEVKVLVEMMPATKVLALSVTESDDEISAWAGAGVVGLVGRDASLNDLLEMIDSACRGEMLCTPRTAAILLARVAKLAPSAPATRPHLTPRELEIVRLIDQGFSNDQIAKHLSIALSTVKNHIHNVLEKLQVHHRTDVMPRLGRTVPM